MKKTGFTLAEVLITLAIIGVVATMTLPALMNNTGEQQAKTALRKAISTLNEIGQTSEAMDSVSYADLTQAPLEPDAEGTNFNLDGTDDDPALNIVSMFARRGNIDLQSTTAEVVNFRDGSSIIVGAGSVSADGNLTRQADGLPTGFNVIYDMNGANRRPNVISNCAAQDNGAGTAEDNSKVDVANIGSDQMQIALEAGEGVDLAEPCRTKNNRVIKDRFVVRLRGAHAEPVGPAAIWAFNN